MICSNWLFLYYKMNIGFVYEMRSSMYCFIVFFFVANNTFNTKIIKSLLGVPYSFIGYRHWVLKLNNTIFYFNETPL